MASKSVACPESTVSGVMLADRLCSPRKNQMVDLILERLLHEKGALSAQFAHPTTVLTRHFVCDNLLLDQMAHEIFAAFPENLGKFRRVESFRERKSTSRQLQEYSQLLSDITFAIQDPKVVALVEQITCIKNQRPDPSLYAGGLSMMGKGDFLNPHIDNSHDRRRQMYRTLNLLYYVTPDWTESDGSNFELWDDAIQNRHLIVSRFNRLVVMETNRRSWHSVNQLASDRRRCCVSNYYFSSLSPDGVDYRHITTFSARPEQPVRRMISRADAIIRTFLRKIVPAGFGKEDSLK